jgi:hypothetical protein
VPDNLADDSWYQIRALIGRGRNPTKENIAAALRRGEPVPALVQTYIADLLTGQIDLRGRPQINFWDADRMKKDEALIARVEHWRSLLKARGEPSTQQHAFEKIAAEIRKEPATVKRYVTQARKRRFLKMSPVDHEGWFKQFWQNRGHK